MFKHRLDILRKVNIAFDIFLTGTSYLLVLAGRIYIDRGIFLLSRVIFHISG